MTRYRTKPQTVEAVQWRGDNEAEVIDFFDPATRYVWDGEWVTVYTYRSGGRPVDVHLLGHGYWIVRQDGKESVYDNEQFEKHFDKIEPREENEGSD